MTTTRTNSQTANNSKPTTSREQKQAYGITTAQQQ